MHVTSPCSIWGWVCVNTGLYASCAWLGLVIAATLVFPRLGYEVGRTWAEIEHSLLGMSEGLKRWPYPPDRGSLRNLRLLGLAVVLFSAVIYAFVLG